MLLMLSGPWLLCQSLTRVPHVLCKCITERQLHGATSLLSVSPSPNGAIHISCCRKQWLLSVIIWPELPNKAGRVWETLINKPQPCTQRTPRWSLTRTVMEQFLNQLPVLYVRHLNPTIERLSNVPIPLNWLLLTSTKFCFVLGSFTISRGLQITWGITFNSFFSAVKKCFMWPLPLESSQTLIGIWLI